MGYLLDTHTFIWMMEDAPQLSKRVAAIILDETESLWISPVSFWEMSIKRSLGKLNLKHTTQQFWKEAEKQKIDFLSLSLSHFAAVEQLPFHHRDPFDRLLIAQAKTEELTLLTRDRHFQAYDVPVVWE